MPTLNWIGKEAVVEHHKQVPYHLLRCDPQLSVGDPGSGNLLIQGDNLLALKALLPESAADQEALKQLYTTPEGKQAVEKAFRELQAPRLAVRQADFLEEFEQTHFLERRWRLSQQVARLGEAEYPSELQSAQRARIDISAEKKLQVEFVPALHNQMRLLASDRGWTVTELAGWLDRTIPHPDITPAESAPFILKVVRLLMDERGLSLDQLVFDKYRLRQAVAAKIEAHRKAQLRQAYQAFLLDDSPLVVEPEFVFTYDPQRYPCKPYPGPYRFNKHYYPEVGDFDTDEERDCALYIDALEQVETWVRNPARGALAFRLQTWSDKFYPDFVCRLKDGRCLVVESKGADRWSNEDSTEKRQIGKLWEARSNGRCVFVMPKGRMFEEIRGAIAGAHIM